MGFFSAAHEAKRKLTNDGDLKRRNYCSSCEKTTLHKYLNTKRDDMYCTACGYGKRRR